MCCISILQNRMVMLRIIMATHLRAQRRLITTPLISPARTAHGRELATRATVDELRTPKRVSAQEVLFNDDVENCEQHRSEELYSAGYSGGGLPGQRYPPRNRRYGRGRYATDKLSHISRRKDCAATLPGGVLHGTECVSTLDVDPSVRQQVEEYLRTQSTSSHPSAKPPEVEVMPVPGTTHKRAVLRFAIKGRPLLAIGESTRAEAARLLCMWHAARLIDYYTVEQPRGEVPAPCVEKLHVARKGNTSSTISEREMSSSKPPRQEDFCEWEAYVRACKHYAHRKAYEARTRDLAMGRIPLSTVPLVNLAALLAERKSATNRAALQQINQTLHGASHRMRVGMVAHKAYAAVLPLDDSGDFLATGVSSSKKEAMQRCAMHALKIVELIQNDCGGGRRGAAADGASAVPSLVAGSHRLHEFYTFLFPDDAPTVSCNRSGDDYVCHLQMGESVYEGHGVTVSAAKHSAVERAMCERMPHDKRLDALRDFLLSFPACKPADIATIAIPADLRERILAFGKELSDGDQDVVSAGQRDGRDTSIFQPMSDDFEDTGRSIKDQPRDTHYAHKMREALEALHTNPRYLEKYYPRRSTLATAHIENHILRTVSKHRVTIICGTTGCGKTTQVPQYLLDHEIREGRGDECCILMTQPRRLNAWSVSQRIADERLGSIGCDVGYVVRLDAKPGRHITVCTSGVLLQTMPSLGNLDRVSHLIIDEVHERDVNCDVLLALTKQMLRQNPRIRVILMSATMKSAQFSSYFGDAPVIHVNGSVYPVEERYLDDLRHLPFASSMLESIGHGRPSGARNRKPRVAGSAALTPPKTDYSFLAHLIQHSVSVDLNGATANKCVLVFLPGWGEILAAKREIEALPGGSQRYYLVLLHSTVQSNKQQECFQPAPEGKVKVVLTTNIAESGITIDDAAVVIDTGLIKQTDWVSTGGNGSGTAQRRALATQLGLCYASQANCIQRKGRAGRTQGGVCYRLITRATWETLPAFQKAEIHRVPLTQVLLRLLSLGYGAPRETLKTFIEPPSLSNVEASMRLLKNIGAIDAKEALTSLGLYLAKLPCDPRIGKMMILGVVFRCLDSVLTVAATADASPYITSREVEKEVRQKRLLFARHTASDCISCLNAFNAYCMCGRSDLFAEKNYLHHGNMKLIANYKWQYREILRNSGFICHDELRQITSVLSLKGVLGTSNDCILMDGVPHHQPLYVDRSCLSENALDVSFIKAAICGAFFPQVAVLDPAISGRRPLRGKRALHTESHQSIFPSRESVCRRFETSTPNTLAPAKPDSTMAGASGEDAQEEGSHSSPARYYVYQDIFSVQEANQKFLTNVSAVSVWGILLFGAAEVHVDYRPHLGLCVLNGWLFFRMDVETFGAVQLLRQAISTCMDRKCKNPSDARHNSELETLRQLCRQVMRGAVNTADDVWTEDVNQGAITAVTLTSI